MLEHVSNIDDLDSLRSFGAAIAARLPRSLDPRRLFLKHALANLKSPMSNLLPATVDKGRRKTADNGTPMQRAQAVAVATAVPLVSRDNTSAYRTPPIGKRPRVCSIELPLSFFAQICRG